MEKEIVYDRITKERDYQDHMCIINNIPEHPTVEGELVMLKTYVDKGWNGKMVDGVRIFSVTTYKWASTTVPVYLLAACVILIFIKETYCKSVYPSTLP